MTSRIFRFRSSPLSADVSAAATNLVWLGAERITQVAVAVIASGLLARYFGAEVFGKWQYANTLLSVAAPLTWVCGNEILVPALVAAGAAAGAAGAVEGHADAKSGTNGRPRATRALDVLMGSAFVLRLSISLLAVLLIWGILATLAAGHASRISHANVERLGTSFSHHSQYWPSTELDGTVAAMFAGLALTMLFREPFGVVSAWLQSRTFSRPALILSGGAALAKAAVLYGLIRLALPPAGFGWVWAAESAVIAGGLVYTYYRFHGERLGWRSERRQIRRFAADGAVFWLGLIGMYGFMKLDRLMLVHYIGFADLGRYAAAQQLNENWITLALMLAQTVAPAFIYRVTDQQRLARNLHRLLWLTALAMGAGAVIIGWLSPFIMRTVFGPGFTSAAALLAAAAWLSVPAGLEAICNLVVLKYQAKYIVLTKWLAALITAFVANLLLIPRLGAYGALLSIGIGYGVALVIDGCYIRAVLSPVARAKKAAMKNDPDDR